MVGLSGEINQMHDFYECLALSHKAEDNPIWNEIYQKAFPGMLGMISYRRDGFWQREGVDRGILLDTTKQIFIDEKVRGRNKYSGVVYDDILLEYLSSEEHNKPGWVCKPLRADYIAYLIAPLGRCYLLPVIQLQLAWSKYSATWLKQYDFRARAKNSGYTTISIPIPVNVLFKAIGKQLRIDCDPFEA